MRSASGATQEVTEPAELQVGDVTVDPAVAGAPKCCPHGLDSHLETGCGLCLCRATARRRPCPKCLGTGWVACTRYRTCWVCKGRTTVEVWPLIDGCCCAGGAAMGYHRAGFTPHGFDNTPQPRYPFAFTLADVLDLDPAWIAAHFVAAHFSPPCQAHSDLQKQSKRFYRDLIPPVRELLQATGLPYVIENVEGAPLRDPVMLCGTMFPGLRVIRHRLFEANFPLTAPPHARHHPLVFTHDKRKAHYGKLDQNTSFVQVTGGGNCTVANAKAAMGIDWMTKDELNEAIPPAYAQYIGVQLMAEVARRQEAAA